MRARLNVTEAERLCYSKRKLQALSALRNAGLSIQTIVEGKQKLPERRGRWYRLMSDTGSLLLFASLKHLIAYAEDVRLYQTTMLLLEADEQISYERWRADGTAYALALLVPQLRAIAHQSPQERRTATPTNSVDTRSACSELDCLYSATGLLDGKPYCAGHAFVYSTLARLQTRTRERPNGSENAETRFPQAPVAVGAVTLGHARACVRVLYSQPERGTIRRTSDTEP